MCNLVSSKVGPLNITSFWFFIFDLGSRILGALMGSTSFVELFMVEVLDKDLGTIFNFLMFANP